MIENISVTAMKSHFRWVSDPRVSDADLHLNRPRHRYYMNTWLLMVSIYALIFCLLFFSMTNISTIIHQKLDANGNVMSMTWEVSNSGRVRGN